MCLHWLVSTLDWHRGFTELQSGCFNKLSKCFSSVKIWVATWTIQSEFTVLYLVTYCAEILDIRQLNYINNHKKSAQCWLHLWFVDIAILVHGDSLKGAHKHTSTSGSAVKQILEVYFCVKYVDFHSVIWADTFLNMQANTAPTSVSLWQVWTRLLSLGFLPFLQAVSTIEWRHKTFCIYASEIILCIHLRHYLYSKAVKGKIQLPGYACVDCCIISWFVGKTSNILHGYGIS